MSLLDKKETWKKEKKKYSASDASGAYVDMALDSELKMAKFKEEVGMPITQREQALLDHERALKRKARKLKFRHSSEGEAQMSTDQ